MAFRFRNMLVTLLLAFVASSPVIVGCAPSTSELSKQLGTDMTVKWTETSPPVLSKQLFDRIKVGMSLDEALAIVRDAFGKSFLADQPPLNPVRYDLTITQ